MEEKQITIKLSDIIAAFLKSFCLILALTVLFAVLGAGFGVYRARNASVNSASYEAKIIDLNKNIDLKNADIRKLQNSNQNYLEVEIPYIQERINSDRILTESRRAYLEESILYNTDPFNCGTSRVILALDSIIPESAYEDYADYKADEMLRIVNACTMMYPCSEDTLKEVGKLMELDVDNRYVSELISIKNKNNQYVEICVYNDDPELAKKAVDYLYNQLVAMLAESYPDCTVSIISSTTGFEVNWDLYNSQVKSEDTLLSAEKSYLNNQTSLSQMNTTVQDNEKLIADAQAEVETMQNDLETTQKSLDSAIASKDTKKSAIKFGIVGFAGGLILACLYVFIRDFLGDKVRNRSGVVARYDFPLLGVLPSKKYCIFTKWVRHLEGDSNYSDEEVISSVAGNVLAVTSVEDGNVCLIGTADAKDPKMEEMMKSLKGQLEFKGNILAGANGIKSIKDFDKVILVEKRNESRYSAISDETARILAQKKEVLGIILL